MFYRESGRLATSHADLLARLPMREDRTALVLLLCVAYLVVPNVAGAYLLGTILTPLLILSLAALGLNLVMGFAGQASLGTGGFMAVGAYMSYKMATNLPDLPIIVVFVVSGVIASAVGVLFGLPSLRLRAFYLAIATLAAQFFLEWLFFKVPWFWNYHPSGVVSTPGVVVLGFSMEDPVNRYLLVLSIVVVMTIIASNLIRSHVGRAWMSIRDNEVAAEIIGIRPYFGKLTAFAVSSFYCGVAGAMWAFLFLGSVEITAFSIEMSFRVMFMIIIGGLGSIAGTFLGAAFVVLLPLMLSVAPRAIGLSLSTEAVSNLEIIIFGLLITFFLIVEPQGLAKLVATGREKLRAWPYPYLR